MSNRLIKDVFLWSAAMCFAFGQNALLASTHNSFKPFYVQLTKASSEAQVFFEAEKLYSVNFEDQSPRTASQATRDSNMKTWANKISNSSERISRNLRGSDLFVLNADWTKVNSFSFENSYISLTLIAKSFENKITKLVSKKITINLLDRTILELKINNNAFSPPC